MAGYGFLSVLEEEMSTHFDYDFAINWDKRRHAVEVSLILEAKNPGGVATVDSIGEDNSGDIVFEDCILFYNPAKSIVNREDYLAVIPYEPKKGLSREFLAYFAQFLNEKAVQGLEDLRDFLENPDSEEFSLFWDSQAFARGRAVLEETDFYSYPRY